MITLAIPGSNGFLELTMGLLIILIGADLIAQYRTWQEIRELRWELDDDNRNKSRRHN